MKRNYSNNILSSLLFCSALFFSCSKVPVNNLEYGTNNILESGTYVVDRIVTTAPESKGITSDNDGFNRNYDPEFIYLHEIGSDNKLLLPVYYYECSQGNQCYGFRYQVQIDESGSVTIIPFDKDRELMETSLVLDTEASCYFSSWASDIWGLPDTSDPETDQVEEREGYYFYKRKNDLNKEIYRSQNNFTIDELLQNNSLRMTRACAGFNLVGLFYDSSQSSSFGGATYYFLDADKFERIMGSTPDKWYIKMYIGGPSFPAEYNIETLESTGKREDGGYYSSGDSTAFHNGSIDVSQYLKFSERTFASVQTVYGGQGYFTSGTTYNDEDEHELKTLGNHLFTPVIGGDKEVHVYVLIKYWDKSGEPNEDWLKSDVGALQTEVNITGAQGSGAVIPVNNNFYTFGLLMDINQFKAVWEASVAERDEAVVTTKNISQGVREFTLDDAITIFETDSF